MQFLAERLQRFSLRLDVVGNSLTQLLRMELVGVALHFIERSLTATPYGGL